MDKLLTDMCNLYPDYVFPNWPVSVFQKDLQFFPISINNLHSALYTYRDLTYTDFFLKTRGKKHVLTKTEDQQQVWEIANKGALWLYFESLFVKLLTMETLSSPYKVLLQYLNYMSGVSVSSWDTIVGRLGVACFEYLNKEPEKYVSLLHQYDPNKEEFSTDHELLKKKDIKISVKPYEGKISRQSSRSDILNL